MRRTIVVRCDLLKSLNSAREPELSAEEKMRKILELHVQEAKTDDERESAMRELQRFSKSVPSGKAKARSEKSS
jgi:hypothetical protein